MKRTVVVILGLCVLTSSGCGREASERFGTDRFVRTAEPRQTRPRTVSAPTHAREFDLSSGASSGASRARRATAAHGPTMSIRAQMLKIKEENAASSVIDDVMTAFKEGTTSELVKLPPEGAQVFSGWVASLETGKFQRSRLRLSRDAQFDRVEKSDRDGREKIRRYELSFGAADFVGWIDVQRWGSRWIIVDAAAYESLHDPTEESNSLLDWLSE